MGVGLGEQSSPSVPEESENWHHWVTDEETLTKGLDARHFAIVHFGYENRLPAHPSAKRLVVSNPTLWSRKHQFHPLLTYIQVFSVSTRHTCVDHCMNNWTFSLHRLHEHPTVSLFDPILDFSSTLR